MDIKTKRLLLLAISCSVIGVILGGTVGWVQSNMCLKDNRVTSECLTQDPIQKILEGMSAGLVAGVGGAFGAAWNLHHQD